MTHVQCHYTAIHTTELCKTLKSAGKTNTVP